MNNHGIPVDVPSVKQIRKVSEQYREEQNEKLPDLTVGKVTKITQVKRIKDYCNTFGLGIDSLNASALEQLLQEELPGNVTQVLEMRAALGLSSLGKYVRMEDMHVNGRIYDNQRYYGALTGRYTGSGVQLLNLPRAQIGGAASTEEERVALVEDEIVKYHDGRILSGNPIKSARALIRPMIKAEPGQIFCAADYSSIEYVVLEWFAGNTEALERFDNGFDPYIDLASVLSGKPYEEIGKKDPLRQLGKIGILGSGYGSGPKTIKNIAKLQYGVELSDTESQQLTASYRSLHHKVAKMWYDLMNAAVQAVMYKGRELALYKVVFKTVKDKTGTHWLTVTLPSGRKLFYMNPFVEPGQYGPQLNFYGVVPFSKKWGVNTIIPGRLTENIVQAAARDLLCNAIL
jgi:DNA polymerase